MKEDLKALQKTQKASVKVIHQKWLSRGFGTKHHTVSLMLEYAALIPHSTAGVEHTFFTMKLICTKLQKTLTTNNLSHCTRISKFHELTNDDFRNMIQIWLSAENKQKDPVYFTKSWLSSESWKEHTFVCVCISFNSKVVWSTKATKFQICSKPKVKSSWLGYHSKV